MMKTTNAMMDVSGKWMSIIYIIHFGRLSCAFSKKGDLEGSVLVIGRLHARSLRIRVVPAILVPISTTLH